MILRSILSLLYTSLFYSSGTSQVALVVKNLPANAGNNADLIPGSERFPGVENGNWLQYYCLEDSMDRGAWWATVHGVTKSQTGLSHQAHLSYYKHKLE